ncbi:MAG TPA: ester cyclase [Polyangiaceae bacterium]|nr:ester cyclase [Polyangiaceae bacterium]
MLPKLAHVLCVCLAGLAGCGPRELPVLRLAAPSAGRVEPLLVAPSGPEVRESEEPTGLNAEATLTLYHRCLAFYRPTPVGEGASCPAPAARSEVVDSPVGVLGAAETFRHNRKLLEGAFPDLAGALQLVAASRDDVAAIWLVRGTHEGDFSPPQGPVIAPTGKKVAVLVAHVLELKEGQVSEELLYWDPRTLLAQIGALPGGARKEPTTGAPEVRVTTAGSDTERANLGLYDAYVAALNGRDSSRLVSLMSDDVVVSAQSAQADVSGKKAVERAMQELWSGVSDLNVETRSVWAAGDYVVAKSQLSGTHAGALPALNLPVKTGRPVAWSRLEVIEIREGQLRRVWSFENGAALAMQLGVTGGAARPDAAPSPTAEPAASGPR